MSDLIIICSFILTPLSLFLVAYLYETYISFRRLSQPKKGRHYVDATWEVTHTFLVVSVALFVGFFSSNLTEIAYVTFYPLFLTSVFVGIRTLAYIYIFVIRENKNQMTRSLVDSIFAFSHVGVIIGLLYLLAVLIPKILSIQLIPNTLFIPWMIPGAFAIIVICIIPLFNLYKTRS